MESDLDGIVEEGCSKQTASANDCQLPQQPSNEPTNEMIPCECGYAQGTLSSLACFRVSTPLPDSRVN